MHEQHRNGGPGPEGNGSDAGAEEDPLQASETEHVDLVAMLRDESDDGAPADLTLGGYMSEHDRPTAFEGADGQPYTVDVDVEETGDEDPRHRFVSFLVFVRWAGTGAGILDHVESGDVAFGGTEQEARDGAMALTLYDVRAELDAAIERRERELDERR